MKYTRIKRETLEYFDGLLEQASDDFAAIGYSKQSNIKRYCTLLKLGKFANKSVLDVGCGIGGLYDFLQEQGIQCEYVGIDINPNMISRAKAKHQNMQDNFFVCDIIEEKLNKKFDYVVSNGPLNIKYATGSNLDITIKLMRRMYDLANIGTVITMTSFFTKKPNDTTFYYHPLELLKEVFTFCVNIKFDHTYLPHDFAVFCYKKDLYDF